MPTVLNQNCRNLNAVTSIVISDMNGNLTSGSTLVAAIGLELSSASGLTVSDTYNGTWNSDANSGALSGNGGTNGAGIIWFASVANTRTGSSGNITVSWTGSTSVSVSLFELSGSAPFSNTGTAKTGTTTLTALGYSITPNNSGAFVAAVGLSYLSTGIAADSGYTFTSGDNGVTWPDGLNNDYHVHEYAASKTGAQSLTFSGTGSGGASMFAAAYGGTGATTPYRGGATATYAAGTSSFAINVASIGIQPGDIVTLWIAGNFTASDPLYNFPGGFGPVKGLVNRSASGTAWLGVAYKIAGAEPTTYTITSGSASVTFTSAVQCRVYSGRSGVVTGTNYLGSSGSAPPVTFQLAGISGNVNDVIVACTMTVPNNTNGTQTLTPSAGFGNALVSTAASVQCTAIAGQDYVSFPGGSTGTIGGVFADTGGESNLHYLGFVMGLGIAGGSTPPSGPMPRQLYIMP